MLQILIFQKKAAFNISVNLQLLYFHMTEEEPILIAWACKTAAGVQPPHCCSSDITSSYRIAVITTVPKILSSLKKAVSKILYLVHRNVYILISLGYFHLFSFYFACNLNIFLFKFLEHLLGNRLSIWYIVEICFLKVCVCLVQKEFILTVTILCNQSYVFLLMKTTLKPHMHFLSFLIKMLNTKNSYIKLFEINIRM